MQIAVKKLPDTWKALGLAVHFVARREPFGGFRSRDLLATLIGQVERSHYRFALDVSRDPARVVGYCGWALLSKEAAEHFAATGVQPRESDLEAGDVVWVLTAVSDAREASTALIAATKALYPGRRVMGVRHKAGRRVVFSARS